MAPSKRPKSTGRPQGRPPDIGEPRNRSMMVRLTEAELEAWTEAAAHDGRTIAAWVRHRINVLLRDGK